jgi:hypothetical protein
MAGVVLLGSQARAADPCAALPDHAKLRAALQSIVKEGKGGKASDEVIAKLADDVPPGPRKKK